MSIFWSTVFSVTLSLYLIAWSGCSVSGTNTVKATASSDATCQVIDGKDSCEEAMDASSTENDARKATPNDAVEIDGEMYRVDKEPNRDSKLVVANTQRLLGKDFDKVINEFGRLGSFMNLAYNSAVAGGPKFINVQLGIQDIGYSIADLFDMSTHTLSKLITASERALIDLESTYDYLINNLEKLALDPLTSILKTAKTMEESVQQLREKAEEEQTKSKNIVEKMRGEAKEESINDKTRRHEQFEQEEEEYKSEAEDLNSDGKDQNFIWSLINWFSDWITYVYNYFSGSDEAYTQEAEAKYQHNDQGDNDTTGKTNSKFKEKHLTAQEKMAEIARKIMDNEDENMAEAVVESVDTVHETIGTIKQFWKQVQQYCEFLASNDLIERTKYVIDNFDEKKRQEEWASEEYKRNIIYVYTGWVAVRNVHNTDLVERIKLTRKNLDEMLEANPTREESLKNVRDLATQFLRKTEKDIS